MNKLACHLGQYLARIGLISEDDLEIYEYRIQCELEIMLFILFSSYIAYLFEMPLEYSIFLLMFMPIRSYTGGLHLKKYSTCLVCSLLTLVFVMTFAKYVSFPIQLTVFISAILLLVLWNIPPVNHKNREINVQEEYHLRVNLRKILCVVAITIIFFTVFKLCRVLVVQAVTLLIIVISLILGKMHNS